MTRAAFEQVLERLQANPLLPSFALMHELGHAQLQLWRQIGGKAAKPIKRRERKPTLVSVARQVAKAELPAAAYEFRPDGTIVPVVGKPNTVADQTDDVTPEDRDQWPKSNSRSSNSYSDPRNGRMRHQFRPQGLPSVHAERQRRLRRVYGALFRAIGGERRPEPIGRQA
jgi:hypothetical protein